MSNGTGGGTRRHRVARDRAVQEAPRCAFCHAGLDLLVALFPRAHAVADAVADGGGCKYLRSRGRGFLPRKSVCRRCQRGMRHVPLQQPRSAATTRYIGSRPTRLAERLKTKAGGEWSSPSSSPSMTTTSASGRERFFLSFPGTRIVVRCRMRPV